MGTVTHPYELIAAALREAIGNGRLAPGAAVPSENELADAYEVGRYAARHALDVLHDEGLIVRRQGAPSRVSSKPVVRIWGDGADWRRHRDAGLPGFDATVAEHGLAPRQEVLDVQDPCPAPPHIAANLGVDDGTAMVMRFVRQYADNVPIRLSRSWFPAEWASGTSLAGRRRIRGGAAGFIEDPAGPIGRRMVDSDVELEGRNPSEDEKRLLRLARGITIVEVVRTFLDADGRPVFVQEEIADASRHRFRFRVSL